MTIGRLASYLAMSKAGVLGHFGSKQELQLATVDLAVSLFMQAVVAPGAAKPAGLARLATWIDAWCDYLGGNMFPGGCFITAASCEFDGRPGPVRDRVAGAVRAWLTAIEREASIAVEHGELPVSADPAQIAFELNALALAANQARQLLHDTRAVKRAHQAMLRVIIA
jgi:AcrR family transcriptional regulator